LPISSLSIIVFNFWIAGWNLKVNPVLKITFCFDASFTALVASCKFLPNGF